MGGLAEDHNAHLTNRFAFTETFIFGSNVDLYEYTVMSSASIIGGQFGGFFFSTIRVQFAEVYHEFFFIF